MVSCYPSLTPGLLGKGVRSRAHGCPDKTSLLSWQTEIIVVVYGGFKVVCCEVLRTARQARGTFFGPELILADGWVPKSKNVDQEVSAESLWQAAVIGLHAAEVLMMLSVYPPRGTKAPGRVLLS
ncbi:unnamed protein product [Ectocarpus sp. 6 AP-2014]